MNDDVLVINKPAGLPVHGGPGGGITLDDYLPDLQFGKKQLPFLAHRLDRDTSGCLILGRNKPALRLLGKLFELKRIRKTYWAVLDGTLPAKKMTINLPLAKITAQKNRWHMQVDQNGQSAISELRVLQEQNGLTWVELSPRTGRTHQLRVHCAAQNCPIIGDSLYGSGDGTAPLLLHARSLKIPYDRHGAPLVIEAPPPPAMTQFLLDHGFSI